MNPTQKIAQRFYLRKDVHAWLKQIALENNRSMTNLVESVLIECMTLNDQTLDRLRAILPPTKYPPLIEGKDNATD